MHVEGCEDGEDGEPADEENDVPDEEEAKRPEGERVEDLRRTDSQYLCTHFVRSARCA